MAMLGHDCRRQLLLVLKHNTKANNIQLVSKVLMVVSCRDDTIGT